MRALITSRIAAQSRTVRTSTPSVELPPQPSVAPGPWLIRARVGFRPNSPHALAGTRIEPPPSLPWATATMPLATAAAAPPDDPPLECSTCHGLRDGGKPFASVVMVVPSSGELVRPNATKPARWNSVARYDVTGQTTSRRAATPNDVGSPATRQPR